MKLGRLAALGVAMLVVASCSEHFPRPLDEAPAPAPPADGSVATPDDAAVTDGSSADASDAGADAVDITDASVEAEAEASLPPIGDGSDCNVRLASPAVADSPHVQAGTQVNYSSNPPSSGPHYPVWANFQEFSTVVPDGNLVHSLEHGAVLLLYNCDPADPACVKIVEGLRAIRNSIATDPTCDANIRVRVIIARRPANDTVIAASAWGQTYRADCLDTASLTQFVNTNYAKAPEDLCVAGQVAF